MDPEREDEDQGIQPMQGDDALGVSLSRQLHPAFDLPPTNQPYATTSAPLEPIPQRIRRKPVQIRR